MDLERLSQALQAAHDAGDAAAATALAAEIRRLTASAPQPQGGVTVDPVAAGELGDRMNALGVAMRNGVTAGFAENMNAGVVGRALGGIPDGQGGVDLFNYDVPSDERANQVREAIRAENTAAQEFPGLWTIGNILGGAGLTSAVAPPLPTSVPGVIGMLGFGGAEGALFAAGNADGQDVGEQALWGAGIGAGMGLLAPAVVAGARAVGRPIGGLLGLGNATRAGTRLNRVMDRAGMDLTDVQRSLYQAELEGQPQFVTADALGVPGQRALAGVARAPGDGRTEIANYLRSRQLGQNERVSSFIGDAIGTEQTAGARQRVLEAQRKVDAGVNYDAARDAAVPVDIRGALSVIDGRLSQIAGVDIQPSPLDQTLARYRARLAVPASRLPPGTNSIELSDFSRVFEIKKDLSDDIEEATRAGRGGEASLLRNLQLALDDSLAQASDGYSVARDTYRQQSQVIDAVGTGAEAARPSVRTQDALDTFIGLAGDVQANPNNVPAIGATATPQDGFRVGYVDPLLARVENLPPTTNALRGFLTPKNQEMLSALAADPGLLASRLGREGVMFDTYDAALRGSKTADNVADQMDMNEDPIDVGLIMNLIRGNIGGALAQGGQKLANAAVGANEATRNLIAQALLSRDPQAALVPLLRQALAVRRNSTAAEAALRQSAYQGLLTPATGP